jgi:hypothetical protein
LTSAIGGGRIAHVDVAQQRRIAKNEALARDANEVIDEAHSSGEKRLLGVFLCECGDPRCDRVVEITPGDYERVRSNPRRFIVQAGHEEPQVETVVEVHDGYVVVEKQGEAGRAAEAENPRD